MCIDHQLLGSALFMVIEISGHDRNFEGPINPSFRWCTQFRDIWISKFSIFFTKTTSTPMPTTPDNLEVISNFFMKKNLRCTWEAHSMISNIRNCGFFRNEIWKSVKNYMSSKRWKWVQTLEEDQPSYALKTHQSSYAFKMHSNFFEVEFQIFPPFFHQKIDKNEDFPQFPPQKPQFPP